MMHEKVRSSQSSAALVPRADKESKSTDDATAVAAFPVSALG